MDIDYVVLSGDLSRLLSHSVESNPVEQPTLVVIVEHKSYSSWA